MIIDQVREPHILCGRSLDGEDIADFMQRAGDAINAGHEQIVPESIFQQMESRRAEAVMEDLKNAFDTFSAGVENDMPLAPSELEKRVQVHKTCSLASLQERLNDISGANMDKVKAKLNDYMVTAKSHLIQKNTNRIMDKARQALGKGFEAVRSFDISPYIFSFRD